MKRLTTLILPLLGLALLSGCAGMGGGSQRNQLQETVQAYDARLAAQEAALSSIADELREARLAREAAALAATEAAEEVPAEPLADESTEQDGAGDGETVVVTALDETAPVETVAVPLAPLPESAPAVVNFAAEDRAQACVLDLMQKGAEVDRPTSAVKAAYVCSHLYGLDHNRGLEDKTVSHELTQDGKAFEASLEQRKARFQHVLDLDSGDDRDYRLGGGFSVLPASLSADTK